MYTVQLLHVKRKKNASCLGIVASSLPDFRSRVGLWCDHELFESDLHDRFVAGLLFQALVFLRQIVGFETSPKKQCHRSSTRIADIWCDHAFSA
jgi:hypothetical protein